MRSIAIISLLLMIGIATPVHAEDRLNPHDYSWENIAGDGSFASSACIGDTSSIKCMIDTIIACEAWSHYDDKRSRFMYDPICDTPGIGKKPAQSMYLVGQFNNRVTWFYYYSDTWPATQRDDLGDIVAYIQMMICQPEVECVDQVGQDRPAAEIIAACPRVDCRGTPMLTSNDDALAPAFTLDIAQTPTGWKLVRITNHQSRGPGMELPPDERWPRYH